MEKVGLYEIIAAIVVLVLAFVNPLYSAVTAIVALLLFGAVNLSLIFGTQYEKRIKISKFFR